MLNEHAGFFLNTRLRQSKRTTILFLYFISLWKILKKLNIIKSETQFPTQKSLIDVVAVSSLLTIQCNTIILDVFNAVNRLFSWSLSAKSMWIYIFEDCSRKVAERRAEPLFFDLRF